MSKAKTLRIVLIGKQSLLKDGILAALRTLNCSSGFPVFLEKSQNLESEILALKPNVIVIQEYEKDFVNSATVLIKKLSLKKKSLLVICSYNEKSIIRYCENGFKNLISPHNTCDELANAIRDVVEGRNYISSVFSKMLVFDLLNLMQNQAHANLNQLTNQETKILNLICKGLSNKEIGDNLQISKRTVETHRSNIKNKMDARNTADMVSKAGLFF